MFEHFVSKPQTRTLLGELTQNGKRVWWEERPPSEEDLRAHLEGRKLLGLVPDKAIGLDFDRTPPEGLRPLLDALSALGTPAYSGPGNTRGSRVWIFLEEPQEDLEALAKGLARVARLLLGPEHAVEAYPNGTRGLFLPLYGFLNGQPRPLYEAWSGQRVGLPFQPRHADPEGLRRLVKAVPFLEVALQKRPSGPRHDAGMVVLNLAHRAGVLEEAKALIGTEPVYRAWGLEDSRTLEAWQEELARLAEAAASPEYDHKRGLPFLKEVGLDPAPLASLLGEVREREEWPEPLPLDTLEAPLPPWKRGLLPEALEEALAEGPHPLREVLPRLGLDHPRALLPPHQAHHGPRHPEADLHLRADGDEVHVLL